MQSPTQSSVEDLANLGVTFFWMRSINETNVQQKVNQDLVAGNFVKS